MSGTFSAMPVSRRPRVLLLTATIHPFASLDQLVIRDPQERRHEYLAAYEAALPHVGHAVDGLVFAENSGADLSEFESLAAADPRVEVLSLPTRDGETGTGRAWFETLLVSDAFERSRLLSRPDATAWKLTGRYQLLNLEQLVEAGPHGHDLVMNLRRYPERWADMWLYAATARGAQLLVDHVDELRYDGAERALYDIALELKAEGHDVVHRLALEPRFSGRRGWDGASYENLPQRSKHLLRAACKRLAPNLWI